MSNFFELIDSMDLNHTDSEIRESLKDMYQKAVVNYANLSKSFNSIYEEREKLKEKAVKLQEEIDDIKELAESSKGYQLELARLEGTIDQMKSFNSTLYSLLNRFMVIMEKKNDIN